MLVRGLEYTMHKQRPGKLDVASLKKGRVRGSHCCGQLPEGRVQRSPSWTARGARITG